MSIAGRIVLIAAVWVSLTVAISAGEAGQDVAQKTEGAPAESKPVEFYNLFDLLMKSERILVGEIGVTKDGVTVIIARQTLKAPENDPKYIPPEKFKAAEQLLKDEKADAPVAAVKPPPQVKVVTEKLKLPPEGAQALFFLWDKVKAGGETVYRIAHPQNLYDVEVLPQAKAALSRPRSVADGRFLRDWDRQMAERVRQREADRALGKAKAGEIVQGMRAKATRPQLSLRGSNSFNIAATIENTRPRRMDVYDGPAGCYGVRLRAKDGSGEPIVLWHAMKELPAGVDNSILSIPDITDFTSVAGNGALSKELLFDAKNHPILAKLRGEYLIAVIYHSTHDGEGLGLDAPVWTGTLISEEVVLHFDTIHKVEK